MCVQLLTFQRLICWPKTGRFSQGNSGPKDTHCQVSSSHLQIQMLYFAVQGLTFFNGGKQRIFSLVLRSSRQAGMKTRLIREVPWHLWLSPKICSGWRAGREVAPFLQPLHWLWLFVKPVQLYMEDVFFPVNLLPAQLNLWSKGSRCHRIGVRKTERGI